MNEEKPMILALDIATSCGYAAGRVGAVQPESGSEIISATGASVGEKAGRAMQLMSKLLDKYDPDVVYVEKRISSGAHMNNRSGATITALSAFDIAIQGLVWLRKKNGRFRPVVEVAPSTVRVHFIKAGKLEKKVAKARVMQRCRDLGWILDSDVDQSDDRSDACAIWSFAESKMAPDLASLAGGK